MPKATKKKAAPAATESKPRGRVSRFAGKKIKKLIKDWPGRSDTLIFNSWKLLQSGMKYEAFLAAGGRYIDLVDMVNQKRVQIVD